jgi:catechol 2,3-dioxygenase-like lactoylglutathione lyase family enzyme
MRPLVLPLLSAALLFASPTLNAQTQVTPRPHILGVSHLCVYASDPAASEHFYAAQLGATKGPDPETRAGSRFYFSPTQFVEVIPLPAEHSLSRIDHVAYLTDDVTAMRVYLKAKGTAPVGPMHMSKEGSWFDTTDPEGNKVQFIQSGHSVPAAQAGAPISSHVIHVGFLVKDRTKEDPFYKGLLNFRPYWFGGMHEGHTDWISQQVPDGTDWLEYMLVGGPSDVDPAKVDAHQLGVLNHFSLGVPSMKTAVATLTSGHRLPAEHNGPQIGKDGKWQYNLYDPDGTRVELMEFAPVSEPCCSPFTASNPTH